MSHVPKKRASQMGQATLQQIYSTVLTYMYTV